MSARASTIAATWPTERHFISLILLGLLLFRVGVERWSRLSEQNLRVDKWSVCRGYSGDKAP
jgi:hypothetical protein